MFGHNHESFLAFLDATSHVEFPKQQSKEYFEKLNQLLTDNGKKFNEPLIYEYNHQNIVFPLIKIKEWDDLDKKYSQVGLPKIIGEIVKYFQREYNLGKEVSFKIEVGRYGRTDQMHVSPPSSKYIYRYILNLGQKEIYYLTDLLDENSKQLHAKSSVREFELGDQLIALKDNIIQTPYPFHNKGLYVSNRYKQKISQVTHPQMGRFSTTRQAGTFFLRPSNYHRVTLIFDVAMNVWGLRYVHKVMRNTVEAKGYSYSSAAREGIKTFTIPKLEEMLEDEMENEKKREKYLESYDEKSGLLIQNSSCTSKRSNF